MKYNNIVRKDLWEEVLEVLYSDKQFESFNSSWGWKTVDSRPYLKCCRFEKTWVVDIVNENDARTMTSETPAVIVSQTGTGKTTFIFKSCLPVALERNKKILYLSNRKSLEFQMKERCMSDELNREQLVVHGSEKILVREMRELYQPQYLERTTQFGGIDVMTYQGFLHRHKNINSSNYAFIIMDEAHFFLSDANFNCYTEEILDVILQRFADVRRIYLTATPEECIEAIYEKEIENMQNQASLYNRIKMSVPLRELKVYVMDEDYSYLRPWFFKTTKFILEKIKHSTDKDSWLIFVRDKKKGQEILTELKNINGEVTFFTAESDKGSKEYMDLITEEQLPTRVVISTKVLDVGINIKTQNLHVVVFEDNMVELKQMIGRKRIKTGEVLEVFFHIPNFSELQRRKKLCEKNFNEIRRIIQSTESFESSYSINLPSPLYYHNGIKCNYFSLKKFCKDKNSYENWIEQLKAYETNENEYTKQLAMLILKNFNGQFFKEMLLEAINEQESLEEKKTNVYLVVKKWIANQIDKENLVLLLGELEEVLGDCRLEKRSDRGHMGLITANKELQKYGYKIESCYKGGTTTYQIVCSDTEGE